ncbi:Holliday junction ATP-dependent DNA helicase RuvB [uncultured archaeon]|nr:Holliday junction ATP-dependent DNA helicase RuvB [uncultured archaeon]
MASRNSKGENGNGAKAGEAYAKAVAEVAKLVVGKKDVVEDLLIAVFSEGHVLLEGVPGIAKTRMANAIALTLDCGFKRIQFTPDMLPSDIIGTMVFDSNKNDFIFKKGPIFTNIILADEINRAPPKTQSALLEAMQEHQVTVEGVTHQLPYPFIVLATQNPIEMEGTYPLPEAQVDRFIFKLLLGYPSKEEEKEIVQMKMKDDVEIEKVLAPEGIKAIGAQIQEVEMDSSILDYIVEIVSATRTRSDVQLGASPRASISLMKGAKAKALLEGRDYVIPDDVKAVVFPVLRHRITLNPESELAGVGVDDVINDVLSGVKVPKQK